MVYLNGRFVPSAEAQVPVTDRAFLFGDGIYEVVFGRDGRFAFWELHMQRLARSAAEVELKVPLDSGQWLAVAERLWADAGCETGSLYLEVSRGVAPREHSFPERAEPTVVAFVKELKVATEGDGEAALAVLLPDQRWLRCDIKSVNLLPNVLARQAAKRQGGREAILVRDGLLTEGAATNLFLVHQGELWTHPLDQHILPGVTRHVVLEEARRLGIPIRLEAYPADELALVDEVFVTGTTSHVLAIGEILGHWRRSGPDPITARLRQAYLGRLEAETMGAPHSAQSAG